MDKETFDLIFGIILTFIVCFGVFGNVLSFVIWTKGRRSKKSPGSVYLRALDVSDTFVLLICATDKAMNLLGTTRLRRVNNFFCKLHKAGWHFGLLVSTWIVVCFTVERTIALRHPRRPVKVTNQGKTVGLIIFIYVAYFLLNIPWIVGSKLFTIPNHIFASSLENISVTGCKNINSSFKGVEIVFQNHKIFCGFDPSSFLYKHEKAYHLWFIDFFLIFSVPFTIIIVCNTAILVIVILRRKNTQIRKGSLVQGVTARAVAVSLVHCISTGPFTIAILVPEFYKKAFITKTGHQYYVGIVTVVFSYINNGVNFILYSFFGTDFRRDCIDLFRKKSRVAPVVSSTTSATRNSWKRSFPILCRDNQVRSSTNQTSVAISAVSTKVDVPSMSYETEA